MEYRNNKSLKKKDIENPTFVTDTAKISTSEVQDPLSVNTIKEDQNKTAERLAFRLNFLQDKEAKFESQNHSRKATMMKTSFQTVYV